MTSNGSVDQAMSLMERARTIAVVGFSLNPSRPSNDVAGYLVRAGYTVYLVNPMEDGEAFGLPVHDSLHDLPEAVDVVDIFRRPELVPPIVDEAIAAKAKAVWMQLAIINEQATETARDAGLEVVMNRCTKIEHQRLKWIRR